MIELVLTAAGAQRVRFASSPLEEVLGAVQTLLGVRRHPVHLAWLSDAPDVPELAAVLSARHYITEFLSPPPAGPETTAEAQLRAVAESVAAKWPTVAVAATHRVGSLAIGDIAVVVAASCPHRGEAFEAARALIDELKATVPIWKHQLFSDGTEEWVGTP